jgi:putative nucleotidyltransferase with HDIG domain
MTLGILYRIRQFKHAVRAKPTSEDLDEIQGILTPEQMTLFRQMQASEQAHSLRVYKQLHNLGKAGLVTNHPDLFIAALLHDIGKIHHPLRLYERVMVVLGKVLFPGRSKIWGNAFMGLPSHLGGWKRPFIVAEHHPKWGAEMAEEAGTSPLAVALIRRHQDDSPSNHDTLEETLLRELQVVDGNN